MDISLPFFSGYYWCAEIRKISPVPIIFLSSAADEMNQVMALSMGGDDFIAKPFGMELAIAKIGAVLRRAYDLPAASSQLHAGNAVLDLQEAALVSGSELHAGNAVLDLQEAALVSGSEKISLSKNEFLILRILFEHKNSPVSREELIRALWNDESFIDDNTLTVNIARIRKKLEEIGLRDFIQTRKGLGYLILIRALWNDESFIDDNTLTVNIARIRKKLEEIGLRDFIQTRKGLGYLIEEKLHD